MILCVLFLYRENIMLIGVHSYCYTAQWKYIPCNVFIYPLNSQQQHQTLLIGWFKKQYRGTNIRQFRFVFMVHCLCSLTGLCCVDSLLFMIWFLLTYSYSMHLVYLLVAFVLGKFILLHLAGTCPCLKD